MSRSGTYLAFFASITALLLLLACGNDSKDARPTLGIDFNSTPTADPTALGKARDQAIGAHRNGKGWKSPHMLKIYAEWMRFEGDEAFENYREFRAFE